MPEEIYRNCASVVVLRPVDACDRAGCETAYQLLLVHKPRKNDAWQLPQGGCEKGESIAEAALRELKEETGIDAALLDTCGHVYQYDFPKSFRRFRPDNVKGQCIHYVFAAVDSDVSVHVDGEEIDDFVWVHFEQLPQYIKRKQYLKLARKLFEDGVALLS